MDTWDEVNGVLLGCSGIMGLWDMGFIFFMLFISFFFLESVSLSLS